MNSPNLYFCVGCRQLHYDKDYCEAEGDLLVYDHVKMFKSVEDIKNLLARLAKEKEDKSIELTKDKKREFTYCPDCHSTDKKGYKGKRCKWCAALLVKDPSNKIFTGDKQNERN